MSAYKKLLPVSILCTLSVATHAETKVNVGGVSYSASRVFLARTIEVTTQATVCRMEKGASIVDRSNSFFDNRAKIEYTPKSGTAGECRGTLYLKKGFAEEQLAAMVNARQTLPGVKGVDLGALPATEVLDVKDQEIFTVRRAGVSILPLGDSTKVSRFCRTVAGAKLRKLAVLELGRVYAEYHAPSAVTEGCRSVSYYILTNAALKNLTEAPTPLNEESPLAFVNKYDVLITKILANVNESDLKKYLAEQTSFAEEVVDLKPSESMRVSEYQFKEGVFRWVYKCIPTAGDALTILGELADGKSLIRYHRVKTSSGLPNACADGTLIAMEQYRVQSLRTEEQIEKARAEAARKREQLLAMVQVILSGRSAFQEFDGVKVGQSRDVKMNFNVTVLNPAPLGELKSGDKCQIKRGNGMSIIGIMPERRAVLMSYNHMPMHGQRGYAEGECPTGILFEAKLK